MIYCVCGVRRGETKMKTRILSAALLAGAVALFATAQANAAVTVLVETDNFVPASTVGVNPTPDSSSLFSIQTLTVPNQYRSPYDLASGAPGPFSGNTYSAIQGGGFASYNIATLSPNPAAIGISLLWGSPDFFNKIEFFNGAVSLGSISSLDLTYLNANPPQNPATGQTWVVISAGAPWTRVVLSSTTNSFEFAGLTGACDAPGFACAPPPGVPLPATLPLFVGGIGFLGFVARRRRQKAAA